MNDMDEIFSVAYLKNATRKSDLIKRLNELHKSLSKLSQDENQLPKELKSIAKQLVSERILNHGDKEIRLVASCCLVDIFRYIYNIIIININIISIIVLESMHLNHHLVMKKW